MVEGALFAERDAPGPGVSVKKFPVSNTLPQGGTRHQAARPVGESPTPEHGEKVTTQGL
jgi:hypothetical protein